MTGRRAAVGFLVGVGLLTGACASGDFQEWSANKAHFASGEHAWFSFRNQGAQAKVTRTDVEAARTQSWWGKPITVSSDQILQN